MCFHVVVRVVVDNLKQFEPAQDAVSLNSFAVSNTLPVHLPIVSTKNSGYMNL